MIRQLPAVAIRFVFVIAWMLITLICTQSFAQVTADDIKDKNLPGDTVEYIAKDAQKSNAITDDTVSGVPLQLTLDGNWNMPGGMMTISGGVGQVAGIIAEFASNSYGIKPGSPMISGSFDGTQFSGTIVLRSKDEDGNTYELATPLSLTLSDDANALSGEFENRRFNKTKKTWSDEKRMQAVRFSRVDPIDAKTLAAIKAAMAKANGEGGAGDDSNMATGQGEDSENKDGSENGPITIASITSVEELGYRNLQVNNRDGKDKDNIGHIWLRITGENLPIKAESLNVTIDDPNITFTGSHKPDPEDEKALQIQVNLAQAAIPGPKQITLNEAPGTWDYDFTDLAPRSIDFVRPVYVDVYNPASEIYRGELFFVQVKYPMPVQFKSRTMELKVGQTKLMDLELMPFEGNKMIFHSKGLILPGDKAALAIFEDRQGTGIDTPTDAITLKPIDEGKQLVAIFPGSKKDVSGKVDIKPYAIATIRGLPNNDWITAVSKAENCWENSSSSAKSKTPKGYTFTNEIIFTTKRNAGEWFSNSRNLHMTIRDHAACLLIRDEAIKQLRAKIQQYNKGDGIAEPAVKNDANKQIYLAAIKKQNDAKRQFAAQMSTAADRGLNHPLMRLQVAGPKNAGQMKLQDAIKSSTLRNAYGDARSIDALNYAVVAIDNAQGVMLGNMNYSLNRLTGLSDCDYEGLLRVCGFGFGSIGQLVKNKLLVPSNEPGVPAGRLVPDRAGYASIDRVNTLYKALRAEEAYARSDTELAIFVATAPFIYISVAATAGTTAASIAGGALVASELAELGLMTSDMYDYIQLRDEEIQFREGLVNVAGTEGLSEVESEANDKYWSEMIAGGAALGGTALGEIGGALLKRFGKSGFQALEEAVEQAAKNGTKSLSKSQKQLLQQADLLRHLGDQPSPEIASSLIQGIRQAKEAAEQTAKQVDQAQMASAADTGVKNTTENLADTVKESVPTVRGGDLADTVSDTAPTVKGEDLIDTVKSPNPAKTGEDLTDTMVLNNPPQSVVDLTDTVVLNNPPKGAEDLTETLKDGAPTVKGEDLIDTVKTPNPPKTGDDLTDTLRNPNPPKSADDLTDTLRNSNPSKSADDLTETLRNPNPPKSADDLTDTLRNPNPPKSTDDLTETLRNPNPPKSADELGTQIGPPKLPADDIGTRLPNQMPDVPAVKPDVPNAGSVADDVLPPTTPKPKTDLPASGSALDVDIDNVVGLPAITPPPAAGSTFTLPDGQQIQLGNKLGSGTFSDVFEIAGDDQNVIKFIRNGEGGEHGLNAWQLALEGKQVSELLDQADIPQLKVSGVDFNGSQPFMIVQKIDDTMQTFNMKQLTGDSRDALRQAGQWTDAHEQAVVELYHNMAKKNLIWEDGHLENLFFKTGPDGKITAGILDHGRIGKWDNLNGSLQNWVKDLGDVGHYGDATGGYIYSNKAAGGKFKFTSPEEFMIKMLEHKRWIEWDQAAKQYKPVRLDPAKIDRNLLDLEKYLPNPAPGSSLPQPFLDHWPWREVLKPAA
jgi:hypothetical protein